MNKDGTMSYKHDADAWITKGTAKVLVDLLNGEHRSEIAHLTLESFEGLGIRNLLTMQRQVGFGSLVERMITMSFRAFYRGTISICDLRTCKNFSSQSWSKKNSAA